MKKTLLLITTSLVLVASCSSSGGSSILSSSEKSSGSQSSSQMVDSSSLSSSSMPAPKRSCGFDGTVEGIHFVLPDLGEKVEIHTDKQKEYLASKYYGTVNKYADGLSEISYQEPVKLSWNAEGKEINNFSVNLSINEDLSNALTFESDKCEVYVDNLMIDTLYYWNVTTEQGVSSGVAKFVTDSVAPRNMRIPGVKNVRDMGGIRTLDGKQIKQNRIFRCGALTLNETGAALITQEGIDIMNNQLHMKTELDLRGETTTESGNLSRSILGPQVNYKLYGLKYNVSDCLIDNKAKLNDIFSLFASEENYPICFHCSEGTDRAGMIAFLLNALLGVSEEDCYRDYMFSAFRSCGGKIPQLSNITNTYVKTIKSFRGSTLAEQTYNALVNFGVSKSVLDNIITLNLGD